MRLEITLLKLLPKGELFNVIYWFDYKHGRKYMWHKAIEKAAQNHDMFISNIEMFQDSNIYNADQMTAFIMGEVISSVTNKVS